MTNDKKVKTDYDNLYINFADHKTKEKVLLESMKDSLVMQEEAEKISGLRKEKNTIRNEIKKEFNEVNQLYQNLRRVLPNLKNVISLTEEEIKELESHIQTVKTEIKEDEIQIEKEKEMKDTIVNPGDLKKFQKKPSSTGKSTSSNKSQHFMDTKTVKKDISKLDRIKNNLKVIENKLNQ